MFVADRACKVQGERTSGQAGQVLDMGYGAGCALSKDLLCLTPELTQGGIGFWSGQKLQDESMHEKAAWAVRLAKKICKGMWQVLVHEYGGWTSSRFSHCLAWVAMEALEAWEATEAWEVLVDRLAGKPGHGVEDDREAGGDYEGYGGLGGIGWQAGREAWAWGS
eukprot:jgi/Botrbrau1/19742/Bobra.0423s0001.2